MPLDSLHNSERNTDFCTCNSCNPVSGSSDIKMKSDLLIAKLEALTRIKAKKDFDQKMAAAIALELENEINLNNRSWLQKKQENSNSRAYF